MTEPHERKFLVPQLQTGDICDEMENERLIVIEQFQEGPIKYRHGYYLFPEEMKYQNFYHMYMRIKDFFHFNEITEGEWEAAKELVKLPNTNILRKRRFSGQRDGYDLDLDIFFYPTKFCMLEVSSKEKPLEDFTPFWPDFKEVTGDPNYSNVNIAAGSLEKEGSFIYKW